MAAVEQPAVSTPGRPNNKETGQEIPRLTNNGVDHPNFDAASALKQKMSGNGPMGGGDPGHPGPGAPPNGSNSPHESNGGPGYPGPGGYPGSGYYPGYGPPKGPPGAPGPGGYPGHGPPYSSSQPPAGGPTPTLNSLLQDRGQRFPASYEGGPPPGPGGPPGGPGGGYPGWGYQAHPHYRGQVNAMRHHRHIYTYTKNYGRGLRDIISMKIHSKPQNPCIYCVN